MKLIAEPTLFEEVKVIAEGKGDKKKMYITGPFFTS